MIKFFSLLILIIFNSCVPIEKETEKFIKKNSQLSFKQNNRIVDFQISDNKKYKAFSVLENKKINIYVVEKLKKKKIKNNIKYKKILKIDDFGNVFYTSTGVNPHYPANSYVFINESKLDVNPGTHIDLILNQKGDYIWKFFHYKQKNNFFYIYHYNSQEDKINYINFKSFPTHIAFCNNEIIKIITNNLKLNETRYYDLKKKKFLKDKIDCNFKKIFKKKPLLITSRGDHNSYQKKLIDSINDTFFNNDPLGNLSLLDNNEGRISWHISKKLEGLIFLNEMYNKKVIDINRNIDIEKLVKKYINNILKSHNISNNYSGWATTKYSRNKDTKLYLSVDNASIFYPLLLGVNSKLGLSTFKKKKILKYFDIFFNNHEVNFNKKKKIYEISDINYKYNGIEPLNWQAMFGLCLLEAYKFSGRDKYLIRLNQITSSIVDQIILQDNQIIWPYHFRDKDFQINNYEDVSHAAITVNFLIEMKKFDEINAQNFKYISSNTANLLSNTLDNMVKNNSFNFPRFIKSNKTNSYSYKYLPDWYWVKLNNKKINQFLSLGLNIKNNNLHNSNLFEYIVVLNKSLQSFTN